MNQFILVLALASSAAFAGKAERTFINESLTPAIAEAESAFKKQCGCPLKMTYSSELKTEEHLRRVRSVANSITEGVKYCTDAASKKAVCQMKTLEVSLGKQSAFDIKGSRGIATTDGQSYPTFDNMMTDKLDQ